MIGCCKSRGEFWPIRVHNYTDKMWLLFSTISLWDWLQMKQHKCWLVQTGLVVMGGDSCSDGHGFESQHRILDGHFLHWFVVKIVSLFVEKTKINKKRGRGMAHFGPIRHSLKSFVAHWSQESFPRLKKMRPRPSNYIAWGTTSVLSRTFDRARNFDMVKRDSKWTFVFQERPQCRKTYFAAKQLP